MTFGATNSADAFGFKKGCTVDVNLCVVDPCTHCSHNVCVTVPKCCECEAPCYAGCSKGLFGRKVLTYKWECCGHEAKVIITKSGKVIAR